MKWFLIIPIIVIVGVFLNAFRRMEAYCFFYPSIDTQYAPGFSEEKFLAIRVGDTAESVEKSLGLPLSRRADQGGIVVWKYTSDGKFAPFGDFAWLYRALTMSNGLVIKIEKEILYN